jgi:hypothetical protein
MKANVYYDYGSPDVLRYEEIDKPTAGDTEVLIKVRAASVNPLDWKMMTGGPYIVRKLLALRKQRSNDPALMWPGRLKRSAGTLRSSNRATRCSARAVAPLLSMRVHLGQYRC